MEQMLFMDIETTGFSAASSRLYLIGCVYFAGKCWHLIQWLAENEKEEAALLEAFLELAGHFSVLVHFNGSTFDLPFLKHRCEKLGLSCSLDKFEQIDLYKRIAPYKYFLKLPNCRQKTLEKFLGNNREDLYDGGELIEVYQNYVKTPSAEALRILLLHNADDMRGMLSILPMLAYSDLFARGVITKKAQANYYKDYNGEKKQELLLTLALPSVLPRPLSISANDCYFSGEGTRGMLKVPIYEEELKYFYDNYRDYYYLPLEDVALHKSIASFVDKEYRVQATAATCYTRKYSRYLPQWDYLITPVFRRDIKHHELFFEITEEMKRNKSAFTDYANHVLKMLEASKT